MGGILNHQKKFVVSCRLVVVLVLCSFVVVCVVIDCISVIFIGFD